MTDNDINLNPRPTPGPWHVGAGLMVCAEDGSAVARCASTRGKYEFEEANARLLAAAPNLLAFVQLMADCEIPEAEDYAHVARNLLATVEGGAA